MPSKSVVLAEVGEITLYKRRRSRHIRLSITDDGRIRVSLPYWVPYTAGIAFANQRKQWLQSNLRQPQTLQGGMAIGKSHRLQFIVKPSLTKPSTRVSDGVIRINLPANLPPTDKQAQLAATKACVRALRQEAEAVLPQRLRQLAEQSGFKFKSVAIKQLKTRWGSCNNQTEIVLNCFLMQLDWQQIDYVLYHELLHTRIMGHGSKFWDDLSHYVPDLQIVRRQMRQQRPTIIGRNPAATTTAMA